MPAEKQPKKQPQKMKSGNPSTLQYKAEQRWIANKRRAIARDARLKAKAANKHQRRYDAALVHSTRHFEEHV